MKIIWSWGTIDHKKLKEHTEAEHGNESKEIHGCRECVIGENLRNSLFIMNVPWVIFICSVLF